MVRTNHLLKHWREQNPLVKHWREQNPQVKHWREQNPLVKHWRRQLLLVKHWRGQNHLEHSDENQKASNTQTRTEKLAKHCYVSISMHCFIVLMNMSCVYSCQTHLCSVHFSF